MAVVINDNREETVKTLNELARHQLIHKIYSDILLDMQICELEGWDKLEFIKMLQDIINSLYKRKLME